MEQPKEKIGMIRPQEWADTHLEAHESINAAITQFYGLFEDVVKEINSIEKTHKDADERNFASFSKIDMSIEWIRNWIQLLVNKIQELEDRMKEWWRYITKRYEWIVDTEGNSVIELDTIWDEELKGKHYLANIVVDKELPNQWTAAYNFPDTSLVFWEYTPKIYLMAKEGEHAVLEYDFTIILTEI